MLVSAIVSLVEQSLALGDTLGGWDLAIPGMAWFLTSVAVLQPPSIPCTLARACAIVASEWVAFVAGEEAWQVVQLSASHHSGLRPLALTFGLSLILAIGPALLLWRLQIRLGRMTPRIAMPRAPGVRRGYPTQ